nr:glycosyltransferase [Tersicoccus phoenicis]
MSVVIGFRDWGIRRLELAVRSIQRSFGPLSGEVIVSDYGSTEHAETQRRLESLGARYVYTDVDGPWSRSRALNAGFAVSRGRVLVSTDADMIFSPEAMAVIGQMSLADPTLALLLQCRDLPEHWSDTDVPDDDQPWQVFERESRLRPRWGMGGMMAATREAFARVRGFDERMHTYGGEDIDFANRVKRSGHRLLWIDDPRVRMYHMWHAPTRAGVVQTPEGAAAVEANKKIVYEDKTFARNVPVWQYRLPDAPPLVTVAICTYNRAEFLRESIQSVLAQTLQDFEIIVVDDGSTDHTREVVEQFGDPRIRYFYQQQGGISAARNKAADEARGFYTAVHDDDDLMTPWRLERHFQAIHSGAHGSFGSFVNFDDHTGAMEIVASKKLNSGTIFETGGAPGHGTWLVQTDIVRRLRYDESLTSGVDNNLALRMIRSGVVMNHAGEIMMLRRTHAGRITVTDGAAQGNAARQTNLMFTYRTTKWGGDKMLAERKDDYVPVRGMDDLEALLPYLPDHLVRRTVSVMVTGEGELPWDFIDRMSSWLIERDENGTQRRLWGELEDATLADMLVLRASGAQCVISTTRRLPVSPADQSALAQESAIRTSAVAPEVTALQNVLEEYATEVGATKRQVLGWIELESVVDRPAQTIDHRVLRFDSDGRERIFCLMRFADLREADRLQAEQGWAVVNLLLAEELETALHDMTTEREFDLQELAR